MIRRVDSLKNSLNVTQTGFVYFVHELFAGSILRHFLYIQFNKLLRIIKSMVALCCIDHFFQALQRDES